MAERAFSGAYVSTFFNQRRAAIVGASLSMIALAGCSGEALDDQNVRTTTITQTVTPGVETGGKSTTTPAEVSPTTSIRGGADYAIECDQLVNGDVMLECTASQPGIYSLYKGRGEVALDEARVQVAGDSFNLIPQGPITAECTQAYVTLLPLPKDGTGKSYRVFTFPICNPDITINPGHSPTATFENH